MAARSRRLIRQAIEIVLRRLSVLSPSPPVEELRARAQEYSRRVDGWTTAAPPPVEERERLMKSVLALHVDAAKLEAKARGGPLTD
jgi:hypothetical protein